MTFGVKIGENDMSTKAKQVSKWLSQNLEVRIAVTGNMQTTKEQLVRSRAVNMRLERVGLFRDYHSEGL